MANKYFHTQRSYTSGNMLSSNSLQTFTLMLMVTMGGLNLCMAHPVNRSVNKEDELIIKKDLPVKKSVPDTDRAMVGDGGDLVDTNKGAVNLEEEERASWETAKYIKILDSKSNCIVFHQKPIPRRAASYLKRREKLYALILSLVLGIFGADWFYLSVTRSIVMNILITNITNITCWIEIMSLMQILNLVMMKMTKTKMMTK